MSTSHHAVCVAGVRKTYGATVAVDEVSCDVHEGEIFGLIGPNGAGKTTTMECVEGLRKPDRGSITVLGLDPFRDLYRLQERIGVQLQQAHLQKRIKVWEAAHLWALVFLDELTTGLDPQARRAIWDLVRGIRARGKTVFMTTHLMEEAERLCDRVAIIEHGRIIDVDTPQRLVDRHCPERTVELVTQDPLAEERFRALPSVAAVRRDEFRFTLRDRGEGFVTEVIQCLADHQVRVIDFRTVLPSLEDVFLKLTGHAIRD